MKPTMALTAAALATAVLACDRTSTGGTMAAAPLPGVCVHLAAPWSTYDCPNPEKAVDSLLARSPIDSVTVTLWKNGSAVNQLRLNDSADAVYFGKRVLDSVMVPYYYSKRTHADSAKADTLKEKIKNFPQRPWWH